jgi:hypothetical protein
VTADTSVQRTARRPSGALRLAGAALLLHLALIQPNHPAALTWAALGFFPLELPPLLLALAVLPPDGRLALAARAVLVALLGTTVLMKIADLATFTALGRAFHPFLDLHLLVSAWHLGSGAVGGPLMVGAVVAAVAAAALIFAALWWATGRWAALRLPPNLRAPAAAAALATAVIACAEAGRWPLPAEPPGEAFTLRLAVDRIRDYRQAAADLRDFRQRAQQDPWRDATPLLDRIGQREVLFVFIESYGASSLRNPLYAAAHRETLARIEATLAADGLAMRSAWLDAPTFGGQSWLSHATLASGLWIDNQRAYGAFLASARQSIFHLAQRAGFRTAAVMPAITMEWPESDLMGFDEVYPAAALEYRGKPFNWVTMPDQFTLAALDRLVRNDGSVFDRWATSGDPPEVVWRDRDRVRRQFRKAIDYSLSAMGAYADLHADESPLMFVIGDHQPARFVSQDESNTVPIHVIGPPELMSLMDGWAWSDGLVPADDAPTWSMSAFRDRFLEAFSSGISTP